VHRAQSFRCFQRIPDVSGTDDNPERARGITVVLREGLSI
jgi:hypothetical protein